MLGDFASLDVQNTYRGSDAYVSEDIIRLFSIANSMPRLYFLINFRFSMLEYQQSPAASHGVLSTG
ncbi:hypothetical protein [Piscirickettsia salmonis]|uniref:hypothetical protein n=1 Tax=Piscirickettsia salmonis TaxID=1238 RepID=UPI0011874263|nr:hypothetical protein GW538_05530 [Piscirickettsia salmonis]QHS28683.1 hypothetical protein GW537_05515 [Piscirickettsia salmonis]